MQILKWIICFSFGIAICAEKTVCLSMIVKNESPVIERCLASVKPFIDYWIIVDTGSTDGTQEIIQEFMGDIPGELYEQPWVNFGFNRNESLQIAKDKADYVLFIDADEVFEGSFDKKCLDKEAYLVTVRLAKDPLSTFQRGFLVRTDLDWRWVGVIHETIKCSKQDLDAQVIENVVLSAEATDGHRSQDPQKYLKDAEILEQALLEDPDNPDHLFYLAQSYCNAGELSLALKNFKKRSKMEGWDQHTFWSKYYVGCLQELMKVEPEVFIKSFCDAYQYRPTRVEPLFNLAKYFFDKENYLLSYLVALYGTRIPAPNDIFYVEDWMYSYGILGLFGNCAMKLGQSENATRAFKKIAENERVPLIYKTEALDCIERLNKAAQTQ